MSVTALVMAGGRGSRMTNSEEKPLLLVGGKPIIMYVLTALQDAKKVDSIAIAVSKYTPKTAKLMTELPVKIVKTPGKEYVSDMGYAVKRLKLKTVLAIGADLPLITGEVLDAI
jgi:GTP:adenosylcobinamide-phosphate guanylyltransferase